jgi:hypothetical protein
MGNQIPCNFLNVWSLELVMGGDWMVTTKLALLLLSFFSAVLKFVALNFDGVSPRFGYLGKTLN